MKTDFQNTENKQLRQTPVMSSAIGNAVDDDDMHWTVNCPKCDRELEYTGFFDKDDVNTCKCGEQFKTSKVMFNDGGHIE